LNSKDIRTIEETPLPEIEMHGIVKKVMEKLGSIPLIYRMVGSMAILTLLVALMPHGVWASLWSGMKAQRTLTSLVLIFSLVAVSLMWSAGQRVDVWIFMVFNKLGKRAPWLDRLMLASTQLGSSTFVILLSAFLFIQVSHLLAYELALGSLSLGLVVGIIKIVIHRTRPYLGLQNIRIVGTKDGGRSFPSGHTSQVFFMATLLLQYCHAAFFLWFTIYALALFVGITRMYLGMHYPRDVLGGAMAGIAWGLCGVLLNHYLF
jgi:membrane-associated phospholipid phosphatase